MHDEYLCDLIRWVTWIYSIDAMYCSSIYFYNQNDTNEQADVRNDDALFTQLCEQIYSGETMTPEHADISVSNTFTEDDGIAPSSPARLQLNQRVQCDGE